MNKRQESKDRAVQGLPFLLMPEESGGVGRGESTDGFPRGWQGAKSLFWVVVSICTTLMLGNL